MNFSRMRCLLASALLAGHLGCTSTNLRATINDVSVPESMDTGYRVVAVDDGTVTRASNSVKTMAPVVTVGPGRHEFTLKPNGGGEPQRITATVEAGKSYRIAMQNGTPVMVEQGK